MTMALNEWRKVMLRVEKSVPTTGRKVRLIERASEHRYAIRQTTEEEKHKQNARNEKLTISLLRRITENKQTSWDWLRRAPVESPAHSKPGRVDGVHGDTCTVRHGKKSSPSSLSTWSCASAAVGAFLHILSRLSESSQVEYWPTAMPATRRGRGSPVRYGGGDDGPLRQPGEKKKKKKERKASDEWSDDESRYGDRRAAPKVRRKKKRRRDRDDEEWSDDGSRPSDEEQRAPPKAKRKKKHRRDDGADDEEGSRQSGSGPRVEGRNRRRDAADERGGDDGEEAGPPRARRKKRKRRETSGVEEQSALRWAAIRPTAAMTELHRRRKRGDSLDLSTASSSSDGRVRVEAPLLKVGGSVANNALAALSLEETEGSSSDGGRCGDGKGGGRKQRKRQQRKALADLAEYFNEDSSGSDEEQNGDKKIGGRRQQPRGSRNSSGDDGDETDTKPQCLAPRGPQQLQGVQSQESRAFRKGDRVEVRCKVRDMFGNERREL